MLLPAVAIDDRQLPSFVVAYGTDMARSITAADWVSQRSNRAREPQAVALAVILRNTDQAGSARQYRGRLHAKDTLTDLMTEGARLGLTKLGKKGEHVLRTAVPTTVELFDLSVAALGPAKGQWLYRMYSGYAHANSGPRPSVHNKLRLRIRPDAHLPLRRGRTCLLRIRLSTVW